MSPEALTLVSLFWATFLSEDLACVTAGVLIQRGAIDPIAGVVSCGAGIAAGDVGLWVIGRLFGTTALKWRWIAPHVRGRRLDDIRAWIARHAGLAIVGSRFLPGTRLPTYVLSGFLGIRTAPFLLWTLIGVAIWTPLPVFFSAALGEVALLFLGLF